MLGKHINISPEEGNESEFLFLIQVLHDTGAEVGGLPI
jgi:hypothetical protein